MEMPVDPIASIKKLETSMAHLWSHVRTFADEVADAKCDMDDLSDSLNSLEECLETLKADFSNSAVQYVDRQKKGLRIMLDDCDQQAIDMETLLTSLWNGPDTLWSGTSRTIFADLQAALCKDRNTIAREIARKHIFNATRARLTEAPNLRQKTPSMYSASQSFLETQPVPYSLEDPLVKLLGPTYERTAPTRSTHHTTTNLDYQRNNPQISHSIVTELPTRLKSDLHSGLDEDRKLSTAEYAQSQDLVPLPSEEAKPASADVATRLTESNETSFEHYEPGSMPSAIKPATLAKDYEIDPLWQPEGSELLESATVQALNTKTPGTTISRDDSADAHRKALLAATSALSLGRRRDSPAPIVPESDSGWACKASASSQKSNLTGASTTKNPGSEAARRQNTLTRNVSGAFNSSEANETNRNDMLRASAVTMYKKMYKVQQTIIDEAKQSKQGKEQTGAQRADRRDLSALSNENISVPQYQNLEEEARKPAQARLAKAAGRRYLLENELGPPPTLRVRSRSLDNSQLQDDDQEASRRITTQLSKFNKTLADIDSKKRQSDRNSLMAAAHRNVTARMDVMDEKVFQETGKQSPRQRELWEIKARKRAEADRNERMLNHGRLHIGGGKYPDQSEIDAIARTRLQPTIDVINPASRRGASGHS